MRIISPSMLAADFGRLEQETIMLERSEAQWIHIDVMDGCFVPNISYGFPVIEAIRRHSRKVLDVHLMITQPERYVERFVSSGSDMVTIHIEATDKIAECIELIKTKGAKAGISIKPATEVETLRPYINDIDLVLVMSVEPGFGGQKFIESTFEKVIELRKMIQESGSSALIEVDGGVSAKNSVALFEAGADAVVAGSAVFNAPDPAAEIVKMLG